MKKITKKSTKKSTKKTIYRSSKTGKIIKKSFADKHKSTTQKEVVHNSNYWAKRGLEDAHRDWSYNEENWVKDYVKSADHPHRELIIDALKKLGDWSYLLEVGCNAGPNLIKIRSHYQDRALAGVDINPFAVEEAKRNLDQAVDLRVASVLNLPYADQSFDVVLVDAVLMYITPDDIKKAMAELSRVAKKAVILIERYSPKDALVGHVWGRSYSELLSDLGFMVRETKIDEGAWGTSKNWVKYGKIFVGVK